MKAVKPQSRLDSLPGEVVDLILEQVIELPGSGENVDYPQVALKNLFTPSALHVCSKIRKAAVEMISDRCLWIHVGNWPNYNEDNKIRTLFRKSRPALPECMKRLLAMHKHPEHGVHMDFVGEGWPLQPFNEAIEHDWMYSTAEGAARIFPFDYRSFALLYNTLTQTMIRSHWDSAYGAINIRLWMHAPVHREIFNRQILPFAHLLAHRRPVTLFWGDKPMYGTEPEACDWMTNLTNEVDFVMNRVQSLDRQGLTEEADLLCMFALPCRELSKCSVLNTVRISPTWPATPDNGYTAANSTSRGMPETMDRLRIMRTMHHLEMRAAVAFIKACLASEGRPSFLLANYHILAGSLLGDENDEDLPFGRWLETNAMTWFGLPDFEMAQRYGIVAKFFEVICIYKDDLQKLEKQTISADDVRAARRQAAANSWYAYRLDRSNEGHQLAFSSLHLHVSALEAHSPRKMRSVQYTCVDGVQRRFGGDPEDIDLWHALSPSTVVGGVIRFLPVLQNLARYADVAYDLRRGDELPKDFGREDDISPARARKCMKPIAQTKNAGGAGRRRRSTDVAPEYYEMTKILEPRWGRWYKDWSQALFD